MAKQKKPEDAGKPLPDVLAALVTSAKAGTLPTAPHEDDTALRDVFDLLRPCMVPDRKWTGQGKQKAVLREPLLMISWDRRARSWKGTITDKQLNLTGSVYSLSISGVLAAFQAALATGQLVLAEREISVDLTEAVG